MVIYSVDFKKASAIGSSIYIYIICIIKGWETKFILEQMLRINLSLL